MLLNIFVCKYLLWTFLVPTHVDSLRITCSYLRYSDESETIDECVTQNLTVNDEHEKVTSISGDLTHDILSYRNIISLKVKSSPNMNFFPKGIDVFFKNLRHLDISECGMKHLSRRDLEVFPILKRLTLRGNELEYFDFNILSSNPEIEYVDLSHNKLTRIDTEFLKRLLPHLTSIDVNGNSCVTGSAQGRDEVMSLIHKIFENCSNGSFGGVKFASFTIVGCLIALMLLLIIFYCLKGLLRQ